MGLWHWSWRGDKRPAWPRCSGSVTPPWRTKGRRRQQQELRLENFVLELLWVMNLTHTGRRLPAWPLGNGVRRKRRDGRSRLSDLLAVSGAWFRQCAEQGPAVPDELPSTVVQAKAAGRAVRTGGRARRRHPQ